MASSFVFHLFLLSLSLSFLSSSSQLTTLQAPSFGLPINKDPKTSLFYASLAIGTPLQNMDLTIDLGGPSLWYDCDAHYNSSSYRPVPCDSKQCPDSSPCMGCDGPFKPGCSNNTCGVDILNPLVDAIFSGNLGQDVIFMSHTKLAGLRTGCTDSNGFSDDTPLQDLPKQSKGIIGLARTELAFPTQLASANKLPRKFALCLPSSSSKTGTIFVGASGPENLFPTPLIVNPVSTAPIHKEGEPSYEYFIDVKSINVDSFDVNFKPSLLSIDDKGNGGTKISTMSPYTKVHSSILKPLVRLFVKKASDRKMKRVASVAPFEACFDLKSIEESRTGLDVPAISLELQGGVAWGMYGHNSMVIPKDNVACLAFVDAGKVPKQFTGVASIVIGGHALEDNYLEFDEASSQLNFSNSLFLRNETCSHSSVASF